MLLLCHYYWLQVLIYHLQGLKRYHIRIVSILDDCCARVQKLEVTTSAKDSSVG